MSLNASARSAVNRLAYIQFAWDHPRFQALCDEANLARDVAYFPIRVAPLGQIPPIVAAAVMPFFPTRLVTNLVARAHGAISPEALWVLAVDCYTEIAEQLMSGVEGVEDLADVLEAAVGACTFDGRPLAAAWSAGEWGTPAARTFAAATVLREYRGDGHIIAMRAAGVSGDEAHVLSRLLRGGDLAKVGHGYRAEDAAEIAGRLETRGWVADGTVTESGVVAHAEIESVTDRLDTEPWAAVGEDGMRLITEIASGIPDSFE